MKIAADPERMDETIHLDILNEISASDFARALEGVFEHALWIPAAAAAARPFATIKDLHTAMMCVVREASPEQRMRFLSGHPELTVGGLVAGLTRESRAEQEEAALDLAPDAADLPELNRRYRERFGIPFIVCVRRRTAEDVLRTLHARVSSDPAAEVEAALQEIGHVTRLRLVQRVEGAGRPRTAGTLSTHVLDTTSGRPAEGVEFILLREGREVGAWWTDANGATPDPLLADGPLRMGEYELRFRAGPYFAGRGVPSFLDTVPVRFRVDAAEEDYHVPLLLAPFGYTTYRGS